MPNVQMKVDVLYHVLDMYIYFYYLDLKLEIKIIVKTKLLSVCS